MFGPVIIKDVKSFPRYILFFMALSFSINGWKQLIKFICFSSDIVGTVPSIEIEYLAFANIKSIIPIKFKLFSSSGIISINNNDNFWRIFCISWVSLNLKSFISLFNSKTLKGSINTVEPLLEVSWIKPLTPRTIFWFYWNYKSIISNCNNWLLNKFLC